MASLFTAACGGGSGNDGGSGGGGGSGGSAPPTTFKVTIENVAPFTHLKSGVYNTKVGGASPGPLAPGDAYEITFTAGKSHRLWFASMFGQSNDWFFAPAADGLALYNGDTPISGDVTDQIFLWDAGTEVNEEPAVGPHTGPLQSSSIDGPGGADPNSDVRLVADPAELSAGGTFDRPAVSEMIAVSVTSDPATLTFTVRIENVADDGATLQTSDGVKPVRISPGVWAVGAASDLLFTADSPDRGEGLETIAESGNVTALADALAAVAGVATPISPGVYVVHSDDDPLFAAGSADRGEGLEQIAEMGNPINLAASLDSQAPTGVTSHGVFNTPVGAASAGPIRAGDSYAFEIEAVPGERLSLAMMFGASNDWVFASIAEGIALFDANGDARSGDVTSDLRIWDVGTELSEEPAVGVFLGGPEGPLDTDSDVRVVQSSTYSTPVSEHLTVTLEPM